MVPFFQKGLSDLPHLLCNGLRLPLTISGYPKVDHPGKRRILQGLSELDLFLIESDKVMLSCPLDAIVFGTKGLYHHLSFHCSSSSPSGNLGKKLKRPL